MAKAKPLKFDLQTFRTGRYLAVDNLGNEYEYISTFERDGLCVAAIEKVSGTLCQFAANGDKYLRDGVRDQANLVNLILGKRKIYVSVVIDEMGDIVNTEIDDIPTRIILDEGETYLLDNHVIEA